MVTTAPRRAPDEVLGGRPTSPERTVLRRRGLPNGRAVTGGLLVAVAAVGLFAGWRAATAGPSTGYVVAATDIPIGNRITADQLAVRRMDLPDALAGRAFTEPDTLVGAVAVAPLSADELIQRSGVVAGESEGSFEVPLPLPAEELPGSLLPGDSVNVLATYTDQGGYTIEVVLDALVTRVSSDTSDGLTTSGTRTITLALKSRADVLAVIHGLRAGQLTLVRSTLATGEGGEPGGYTAPGNEGDDTSSSTTTGGG